MAQTPRVDSPRSRPPEPWGRAGRAVPEGEAKLAGSGPTAQDFVVTASCARVDLAEEGEARSLAEMRYQEYVARRALEELFERGELERLPS
jgi:hypothetical protein